MLAIRHEIPTEGAAGHRFKKAELSSKRTAGSPQRLLRDEEKLLGIAFVEADQFTTIAPAQLPEQPEHCEV